MNSSAPVAEKPAFNRYFLLPLLPILFFFLHNFNQFTELIFTWPVLKLFLVYAALAFLFVITCKKIVRLSLPLSIFASTILITGFLFFGVIQDWLFRIGARPFITSNITMFFLLVVPLGLFVFLARSKQYRMKNANRFLVLLFSVLVSYESILLCVTLVSGKNLYALARHMVTPIPIKVKNDIIVKPDIFHIVFDSYTNRPILNKHWQFDNDIYAFFDSLGFYTVDSAICNYKTTPFSLSSTFNLQYLKGAEPFLVSNSSNFLVGRQTFLNNVLYRFLKEEGYEFLNFSMLENEKELTGFGFIGVQKPVSWLRNQTMERIYLNPWLLNKITRRFRDADKQPVTITRSLTKYISYNNKAIEKVFSVCSTASGKDVRKPIFSYIHIILPHDPYLFDENGNLNSPPKIENWDLTGYLGQLKYCNKLIRKMTACLLADTTRPKVIIFQGDHGFRNNYRASLADQYGALSAIYFPDHGYEGLHKNMSHVNTYRVVLNKFFGADLPLLKDTIIWQYQ